MGKSSVNIVEHPHGRAVQVEGVIDKTFDLGGLAGDHEIVLFDLDGVARITSFGVREWRTALAELSAEYVCFVRCHPAVLSQFNLVPGFGCGGQLVSFYLPYICTSCDQVTETLVDLRRDYHLIETLELPVVACPRCGGATEFDDIPASYFKYVRSAARPQPPAAASSMIDGGQPQSSRREFAVKKEVEDTVTAFWLSGFLESGRQLKRLTEGVEGHVAVILSDLDGATASSMSGLAEFLRAAGDVHLCRVPAALIDPLLAILYHEQLVHCRVASVELSISCTACGNAAVLDVDRTQVVALADDSPMVAFERCTRCARPLTRAGIPHGSFASICELPWTDPPEAVRVYLQSRSKAPPGLTSSGTPQYAPSQLLFGKYRILRPLAEGGMGEVLLARYVSAEQFEKLVVVKRIRRDRVRSQSAMAEFQREARITARLSHPNIVQIFDFSKIGDEYFLAMEYVHGMDLRRSLRLCREAQVHWPFALCMRVVSDLCAGLHAAHTYCDESGTQIPIIHRDVSPENIIISVDGVVKLTDFGIAKAADSSIHTGSGVFKGKHAYSAPELFEADVPADHRSDVYAAGIILYECLSARRFIARDATPNTVYATLLKPPPPLSQHRPDVPAELQPVFERAIARNPDERYQSARELQDDLEQLLRAGRYPTNQDLAVWIRRVMALDRGPDTPPPERVADPSEVGESDYTETTGDITVAENPSLTKKTTRSS